MSGQWTKMKNVRAALSWPSLLRSHGDESSAQQHLLKFSTASGISEVGAVEAHSTPGCWAAVHWTCWCQMQQCCVHCAYRGIVGNLPQLATATRPCSAQRKVGSKQGPESGSD